MKHIILEIGTQEPIRTIDSRLASYNIEMTEVTGGNFWRAYTPEQIAGTEKFPSVTDMRAFSKLTQWYDPIDLYNPRLRKLTKARCPLWLRVSGTGASKTYYDLDGEYADGTIPEGYERVLTQEQWIGVLEFVKAVGGKLLVSLSNCPGLHSAEEPWPSAQAEKLFAFSAAYGVPIDGVEFMNEPNMLEYSGAPKGYTPKHFVRDQDIFHKWVRQHYPDCVVVGPSSTDSGAVPMGPVGKGGAGVADIMYSCSTDALFNGAETRPDIFSYHYYNGISERLEGIMPAAHWSAEEAQSEAYLSMSGLVARAYSKFRDKYTPSVPMWVTESGDAGGGGNTWGSTCLDVLRTLNELGDFATVTDGIIFHNTLASSSYGWLEHGSFEPRPNYFAVLLWNTLMGTTVYDSKVPISEGAHVYCHSRKDGKDGCVYLVINNSKTDITSVELPKEAIQYTLDSNSNMRSTILYLNGKALTLDKNDELPEMNGENVTGTVNLAPGSCTFFVF